MTALLQPGPLYRPEVERALIAALVTGGAVTMAEVAGVVAESAFADPICRMAYHCLSLAQQQDLPVDVVTLEALWPREASQPVQAMLSLLDEYYVSSAEHALAYAKLVLDAADRRWVQQVGAGLQVEAGADAPVEHTILKTVDALAGFQRLKPSRDESLPVLTGRVLDRLDLLAKCGTPVVGLGSDLRGLDGLTHGWQNGHLIVVAARPGIGKTSLAVHLARAACQSDAAVLFITLEQPPAQLVERVVTAEVGMDLWSLASGVVRDMGLMKEVVRGVNTVASWSLTVLGERWTAPQVWLAVQQWRARLAEEAVPLVVVDYLGKMHSGHQSELRWDLEIGERTASLARLALELDLPVIVMHQLSRRNVQDSLKPRRPRLSDLRDSGHVEQDASIVVAIHPLGVDGDHREDGVCELLVLKNRHGPTGRATVAFDRSVCRWVDAREREVPYREN